MGWVSQKSNLEETDPSILFGTLTGNSLKLLHDGLAYSLAAQNFFQFDFISLKSILIETVFLKTVSWNQL